MMFTSILTLLLAAEPMPFRPIPLQSQVTRPAPQTGIVLWTTSEKVATDAVQLEYRYFGYNEVVREKGKYDWSLVDRTMDEVAKRGHQLVLRWYFVYPGQKATVPDYIKQLPDYRETKGLSEKLETTFCDWSHAELQRFTLEFYERFVARYDRDARLAYLQTGFGLWAEYHIYDGPMKLGLTFPDKAFQAKFARHLDQQFNVTPWMISKDAADEERAPFAEDAKLRQLGFGIFDDSFLHRKHNEYNASCWKVFDRNRWRTQPAGGEFSYYTKGDQKNALAEKGPHGISFEQLAAEYHLSFIIGNDQPRHRPMERIRAAGMAIGYRFKITALEASDTQSRVTIRNIGIAPSYYDAYPTINGKRASESLRGLLPDTEKTFLIEAGGAMPKLTIESDRLVPGQRIEFDADLPVK